MSDEKSSVGLLAGLLASPIILAITLIVFGIVFLVAYLTLASLGLVSAVVFALAGLCIIWLIRAISRDWLSSHAWVIAIVPLGFAAGFVADRLPSLARLSVLSVINAEVPFGFLSLSGGEYVMVVGPYAVAIAALVFAVLVLAISFLDYKKTVRKRYGWVRGFR